MSKFLTQEELKKALLTITVSSLDEDASDAFILVRRHIAALNADLAYAHQRIKETKDEHAKLIVY